MCARTYGWVDLHVAIPEILKKGLINKMSERATRMLPVSPGKMTRKDENQWYLFYLLLGCLD